MPRVARTNAPETPQVVINTGSPAATTAPAEPQPEKTTPELWSYVNSLTPDDWKRHAIYLYRTKPVVGMKSKESYLDVFSAPFTIEDVKAKFGGEEFTVKCVRNDNGKWRYVCVATFSIEAAPKYDTTREAPMGQNVGAPTSAGAAGDAVTKKVVDQFLDERRQENDMFQDAHRKTLELVTDGYKQVAAAAAESSAGKPNGQTNDGDLVKVLLLKLLDRNPMKEMMEALAMARELGLIPAAGAAGPNALGVLGQVKEVLGLVKELGGEMGGGARGRAATITETIMEHAPTLIEKGVDALGKLAEIKAQDNKNLEIRANAATRIAQINRSAQPQAQPPYPESPIAVPGAPQPMPPTPPAAGGGNGGTGGLDLEPVAGAPAYTAPPPFIPSQANEAEAERFLFTWISARVVQMVAAGAEGGDVIDFVENCDPRITDRLLNTTPEGLRLFFAADPTLSTAMKLPRWEAFFAEACADLYESEAAGPVKVN